MESGVSWNKFLGSWKLMNNVKANIKIRVRVRVRIKGRIKELDYSV